MVPSQNLHFRFGPDIKVEEKFNAIELDGFGVERDRSGALFLRFGFTVPLEECSATWIWRAFGTEVWMDSEECQRSLIPSEDDQEKPSKRKRSKKST